MSAGGGDEFDLIARYFAPLANTPAARGLLDDAAVLSVSGDVVLTTDAIVQGVHFTGGDPLDMVARKALRVNLSDLAAKGASPIGYLLTIAWPEDADPAGLADISAGLAADQSEYGLHLLGGDTVSTWGPLVLSVTALGKPLGPRAPSRSGAEVGDDVWVTGAIGDGALGLLVALGHVAEVDASVRNALLDRYRLPRPRLAAAGLIAEVATAAMDVSDGLAGDAAKIAAASGVAIELQRAAIPLSEAARAWLAAQPQDQDKIFNGDDYEILFTAPPAARPRIESFTAVGITRIGAVCAGAGVTVDGGPAPGGFSHRLGQSRHGAVTNS